MINETAILPYNHTTIEPYSHGYVYMPITPYGNAEPGDYPALFTGCFEARYPKGSRLIFGFAILNSDRQTPHDGPDGGGLYAVAVCNRSEGANPKSKPFKIRRAMLQQDEFADLMLAVNPPPTEHFMAPHQGRPRVLDIRAACRETDGTRVSIVTHICQPRDGMWQNIEGRYEGSVPTRPFWLRRDGTALPYTDEFAAQAVAAGRLSREDNEAMQWRLWNGTNREHYQRWVIDDGSLQVLSDAELGQLGVDDRIRYNIAKIKARNNFPL